MHIEIAGITHWICRCNFRSRYIIGAITCWSFILIRIFIQVIEPPIPPKYQPVVLREKNTNPQTPQSIDLEEWITRYPDIKAKEYGCAQWKCTTSYNHTGDSWISRRNRHNDKRFINMNQIQNTEMLDHQQECEFIFIGDSLTAHWKDPKPSKIFNSLFNSHQNGVIYGRSGDIISDVGWRMNQQDGFKNLKQCLLKSNSSRSSIILLIGTNDIGSPVLSSYGVALRDYNVLLQQFTEFTNEINHELIDGKGTSRKVVLNVIGLPPRGNAEPCPQCEHWNRNNSLFLPINIINDYLKTFVESQRDSNIRYIDCNHVFLQQQDSVMYEDMQGNEHRFVTGYINRTILQDRLHFSELGYKLYADCLLRQLKVKWK